MTQPFLHLYVTLVSALRGAFDGQQKDRGATAVEYGLLVGLIAVAIIISVGLLGDKLDALFNAIQLALPIP